MERTHEHGQGHGRGRGRGRGMRGADFPGGFGGGLGGGFGGGRRRMRRGDIRKAVLSALVDGAGHGYDVMRRLEERSGGIWRPSPGSVYPTLQMLEDEGLVRAQERDGTRVFELTDSGRAEAAANAERPDGLPWEQGDEQDARLRDLRQETGQTFLAVKQVARAARPEQVDRSLEVLQRARKELYKILAED